MDYPVMEDVEGGADWQARTPFDAIQAQECNDEGLNCNREHIEITERSFEFLLEEIYRIEENKNLTDFAIDNPEPPFRAGQSVTVGNSFVVDDGGEVELRAGESIVLGPGFRVEEGGEFSANVDPSLTDVSIPWELYETSSPPPTLANTEGESSFNANATGEESASAKSGAALGSQSRASVPTEFSLGSNYPNPFRTSTEIRFGLPETAEISLEVYDILGRRVARLAEGRLEAGFHRARLDGFQLSSGVYVYRLVAGDFTDTRRMVVVK